VAGESCSASPPSSFLPTSWRVWSIHGKAASIVAAGGTAVAVALDELTGRG